MQPEDQQATTQHPQGGYASDDEAIAAGLFSSIGGDEEADAEQAPQGDSEQSEPETEDAQTEETDEGAQDEDVKEGGEDAADDSEGEDKTEISTLEDLAATADVEAKDLDGLE
ncbi:MAG: hypothetical protein ACR2RE_03585, partial [Geminicoccaceae bacterium]